MDKDIVDRIDRVEKVTVSPGDMLLVFVDLTGMTVDQTEVYVDRTKKQFEKAFSDEVDIVVINKNVDIAVVSKTSSEGRSDAS